MTVFAIALGALCILAVAATVRALVTDGYRPIPTRTGTPARPAATGTARATSRSRAVVTWSSTARGW